MKRRMHVVALVAALSISSCGGGEPKVPGSIIGYDTTGIVVVPFASQKRRLLVPQVKGHWRTSPTYDLESKTLFYVDVRRAWVQSWKSGAEAPVTLCKIPPDYYAPWTAWLLLSPDKRKLFFLVAEVGESKLMAYDRNEGSVSVAFEGNMVRYQRPAWIDESRLLVGTYHTVARGKASHQIQELDLTKKELRLVMELKNVPCFALSDSKARLCVRSVSGYDVYDFPSLEVVKTITNGQLPGKGSTHDFCFAGDDHLVIFRTIGPMRSLGTYVVDVSTGKSYRLKSTLCHGMNYLPGVPD